MRPKNGQADWAVLPFYIYSADGVDFSKSCQEAVAQVLKIYSRPDSARDSTGIWPSARMFQAHLSPQLRAGCCRLDLWNGPGNHNKIAQFIRPRNLITLARNPQWDTQWQGIHTAVLKIAECGTHRECKIWMNFKACKELKVWSRHQKIFCISKIKLPKLILNKLFWNFS